jgi:hypothetical protein
VLPAAPAAAAAAADAEAFFFFLEAAAAAFESEEPLLSSLLLSSSVLLSLLLPLLLELSSADPLLPPEEEDRRRRIPAVARRFTLDLLGFLSTTPFAAFMGDAARSSTTSGSSGELAVAEEGPPVVSPAATVEASGSATEPTKKPRRADDLSSTAVPGGGLRLANSAKWPRFESPRLRAAELILLPPGATMLESLDSSPLLASGVALRLGGFGGISSSVCVGLCDLRRG